MENSCLREVATEMPAEPPPRMSFVAKTAPGGALLGSRIASSASRSYNVPSAKSYRS
jgi:hypothetical protein